MSAPRIDVEPGFRGLRALAGCGGCAAKAPPELVATLAGIARGIGAGADANVLVGLDPPDDATVYALDAARALVATVDFFPPLVDDPDDYGAIAAANAFSDVYAMGGTPAFALAISGFPREVPEEIVGGVLRAAAAVAQGCDARILGGHTVRCSEPLFGLAVLGFVDPRRIWRKAGAQPGQVLVLSKPLGTGVLLSDRRANPPSAAIAAMRQTNRRAAEALHALPSAPGAVTDISGYGLLGHALEMAQASGTRLRLDAARVPLLEGARERAEAGVRTSAHPRSAETPQHDVRFAPGLSAAQRALLWDPQTSGGLLAAVEAAALSPLQAAGYVVIGEVAAGAPGIDVA